VAARIDEWQVRELLSLGEVVVAHLIGVAPDRILRRSVVLGRADGIRRVEVLVRQAEQCDVFRWMEVDPMMGEARKSPLSLMNPASESGKRGTNLIIPDACPQVGDRRLR
jgi:hypothetical protein